MLVFVFFYDSIVLALKADKPSLTYSAFNWGHAGNFLGLCTYSYESIGSIYNGNYAGKSLIFSQKNNEE